MYVRKNDKLKICEYEKGVILSDDSSIPIDDIIEIKGSAFSEIFD